MDSFGAFVEEKKRKHARLIAENAKLRKRLTWRMRLRVRLGSTLNTDSNKIKAEFCGRRIVITSRKIGESLNQAYWIVISANRFTTAESAAKFGLDLQAALSVITAMRGLPVDVGFGNLATSSFSNAVKDAVAKTGAWLIDDVHGVDIYPDTNSTVTMSVGGTLTTSFEPMWITGPLGGQGKLIAQLDIKAREACLLINAALMAPHPVAKVTLAVAAVELLAASERWNTNQKQWITGLREHLEVSAGLSEEERNELRQAIDGLNHFGAMSRTKRLLTALELDVLLERWDDLYRQRSRLFHGAKIAQDTQIQAMGGEALAIGQAVVQTYIERSTGAELI